MKPVVGLYFISGTGHSYPIAKSLALGGCRVVVRSETSRTELADAAHPHFVERQYALRLYSDPDIEIISDVSESPAIDALLFEVCDTPGPPPFSSMNSIGRRAHRL